MPRKKKSQDPFANREKKKYGQAIPSREFILEQLQQYRKPAPFDSVCTLIGIKKGWEREALNRRLRAMIRDGQLILNRRHAYCLVSMLDVVKGRVQVSEQGQGIVEVKNRKSPVYLAPREMQKVFHGDLVLVCIDSLAENNKQFGHVVEVLEYAHKKIIGRYYRARGMGIVKPEDSSMFQAILIPPDDMGQANEGDYVEVVLTRRPDGCRQPMGRVDRVYGKHLPGSLVIQLSIDSHDLPAAFSTTLLEEAQKLARDILPGEKKGRVDLTQVPLVTIDGEDARDFDDAVFCQARPNGGWRLVVAIADVSHYVRHKSTLDEEAYNRGNSVYFPNKVLPMLPEALSNEMCSLKPQVERLAMVADMTISANGRLSGFDFFEAVIQSHARLTYEAVQGIFDGDDFNLKKKHQYLKPHLWDLHGLYQQLKQRRHERGGLEFDVPEPMFEFSKKGKLKDVVLRNRNDAHKVIEECMILANVAAARYLRQNESEGLYRIHDTPVRDKVSQLNRYLNLNGVPPINDKKITSKSYAEAAGYFEKQTNAPTLVTLLLRTMPQALYSPSNIGHFGLALPEYVHFTSPIRRYPDLVVHRLLKAVLKNKDKGLSKAGRKAAYSYEHEELTEIGLHCVKTERRADDATRETDDWFKCAFMRNKTGMAYEGIVSSVTGFGMFITLREWGIDGLLHVSALDNDYYHFDDEKLELVGERTGYTYKMGQSIAVMVNRVNMADKKIDFVLA